MRIAITTESFLPTVNGVTSSVVRVLDHLRLRGHEAVVICPSAGAPSHYAGFPVVQVPAVPYRSFPVGIPTPLLQRTIARFEPDVVHVASPFFLGSQAIEAARRLGIPSVAIFQTDVAGYARRNHLAGASKFAWRLVRTIHENATVTLAPSTAAIEDLERAGVPRVATWARGVDLELFHPRRRTRTASDGDLVVGYAGRLAPEKRVERMRALRGLRGVRFVVVGDGPSRASVHDALRGMPVEFTGQLTGTALAERVADFDVFVHTGTEETFGQTVQEAHSSSVATVVPHAGGPIDLVDHGVDGLFYAPESDHDLRRQVARLVEDDALRHRLGEAGRRRVLNRDWAGVCDELLEHYRRAAHAVSASRRPAALGGRSA